MIKTIWNEWNLMRKSWMMITVLIIIPIGVNILLGFELEYNQIQHIPMAVVDQDNSSLSRMIVQQFKENEMFDVRYYPENSEELKTLMDHSRIRTGMIIPKNFSNDVMLLKSPSILMLYDGSHMSIASSAKTRASEILLTLRTGTLIKLIQAKLNLPQDMAEKIALAMQFSNRTLYNPTKSFKNFLTPGFGTAIVQTALILLGASAVKSEELSSKKRKRFGYLLGKTFFYSASGTCILIICILIQTKCFGIPFRGNLLPAFILSAFLSASVTTFSLAVSTWVRDASTATVINAIIFIPNSIMVGYTWPVLSMPKAYQIVAEYVPFYHYADPIRDLFLKGQIPGSFTHQITWFCTFIIIFQFIALLGIMHLQIPQMDKMKSEPMEEGHDELFQTTDTGHSLNL